MAKPIPIVKRKSVPIKPAYVSRIIFCQLFGHQKNTDVCTVLRAKRVCRVNCSNYFGFVSEQRESASAVIEKYKPMIINALGSKSKTTDELLVNVLPKGENICDYCAKPFKHEKALKKHIKTKHRRELSSART